MQRIGKVVVGGSITPVLGPGEVVNASNNIECQNCVLAFLPKEFCNIPLFPLESKCGMGSSLNFFNNLSVLTFVLEVNLNVIVLSQFV